MNQYQSTQALTIAQWANHPKLGFMTLADISTDEATIQATVARFEWLRELDLNSDPALLKAANNDVREDGELFVMLNIPASQLYKWFRRDDWSIYETSEILGENVSWALDVLDRVKVLIETEGALLAS